MPDLAAASVASPAFFSCRRRCPTWLALASLLLGACSGGTRPVTTEPVPALAGPWLLVHRIVEAPSCTPLLGNVLVARAEILQDGARVRLFVVGGLLEMHWSEGALGGSGSLTDGNAAFVVEETRLTLDDVGELSGDARWRIEAAGAIVCRGRSSLHAARIATGTLPDVSGEWRVAQEVARVENGCTGGYVPTTAYDARMTRSGDELLVELGSGTAFEGRAVGNVVQWTTSRASGGSLTVERLDLLVSRVACLGEADWTWTTSGGTCRGTSVISGLRKDVGGGVVAASSALLLVHEDRVVEALPRDGGLVRLLAASGERVEQRLSPGESRLLVLPPGAWACTVGDGSLPQVDVPPRVLSCAAGEVFVVTTSRLLDWRVGEPFQRRVVPPVRVRGLLR